MMVGDGETGRTLASHLAGGVRANRVAEAFPDAPAATAITTGIAAARSDRRRERI